jgi:cation diffusion facilitator CzcD-associated flavoprotein CzcO
MTETRIAIVGSGFGGLGAAIRLKLEGIDDFVVLERAGDVGGTWRDNTYPGCACDVESHLYSFSFAPEPDWTYRFSRQPEIWRYLQRCAHQFDVMPHIRFNRDVKCASWSEQACRWRIETSDEVLTAQHLVLALGPFSETVIPDIPGLERFEGRAFHSARWDHTVDLTGCSVAVVGTGASAIQLIPAIQPQVGKLHVFQRTAPWVVPRRDAPIADWRRWLYRNVPSLQRTARLFAYLAREWSVVLFRHPTLMRLFQAAALRHLKNATANPVLRAKLTPSYTMGCKRVLLSDDYYPAVAKPNVDVVTGGIRAIRAHSIVGNDDVERPVDAIVFATGFRPTDPPLAQHIRGRDGHTLAEVWHGSPKAHVGTTVAGFPNLFIMLGPNTGVGHGSVVYMTEAQIDHFIRALRYMRRHGMQTLEPRAEAQDAYVASIDRRIRGTVWASGGCRSWYFDRTGRNSSLWPDWSWSFYRRVAAFKPYEYVTNA